MPVDFGYGKASKVGACDDALSNVSEVWGIFAIRSVNIRFVSGCQQMAFNLQEKMSGDGLAY